MGKYVVKRNEKGIRFQLRAANGEIIGLSEQYNDRLACRKGLESVRRNAPVAALEDQTAAAYERQKHPKFELYVDRAGEYRYRLRARNGQIILVGEGYKQRAGCLNGIDSVRRNADSPVVEEPLR